MELSATLIFLGLVINRVVEQIKALLPPADEGTPTHRQQSALILALSFVLGATAMVLVFPTENMFPEAISPFVGLVFTGILVGGIANGWDFGAGVAESLKNRIANPAPKTNVTVNASAENTRAGQQIASHVAETLATKG